MTDAPTPVTEPLAGPDEDAAALALGAALIRGFEGFRSRPYQDQGGTWTIGYGTVRLSNAEPVSADTPPITMDQAEALLQAELQPTARAVDAMLTVYANVNQRAALYSFAYNLGVGPLHGSTLLRLFNEGDAAGASAQFGRWVNVAGKPSDGLKNRREAERAVFDGETPP